MRNKYSCCNTIRRKDNLEIFIQNIYVCMYIKYTKYNFYNIYRKLISVHSIQNKKSGLKKL